MSGTLRRYFRGADLVSMWNVPAGTKSIYHFDHQGTTQCLTDAKTGAVTDTFAADAWGVPVKRTGTGINRQWYIGNLSYYQESDRAINYIRARELDPSLGRWLSTDPYVSLRKSRLRKLESRSHGYRRHAGIQPLRASIDDAYSYSASNPAIKIDPSGQLWVIPFDQSRWVVGNNPDLCGQFLATWIWFLDKPAACDGWIVQRVHFTQNESKCGRGGILAFPVTYFEAWPVAKGESIVTQGPPYAPFGSFGPNDGFSMDGVPNTFGEGKYPHSIRGDAKFFCEDVTGGPLDKTWTDNVPRAGGLPSVYGPPRRPNPTFWNGPSADPPDAAHWCIGKWNCCGGCKGSTSSSVCSQGS